MADSAGLPVAAHARTNRAVYEYDFPATVQQETGFATVGIVALTVEEEMMAIQRADGTPAKLAFELAKQAMVSLGGKPVNTGDASADRAWQAIGPSGRRLVTEAFGEINTPQKPQLEAFLGSRRVVVG